MLQDEYGNRRFYGVYRAVVVDTHDPENRGRLRLKVPQILSEEVTGWAWPMTHSLDSTSLPKIGDSIFSMFEAGDPSYPLWISYPAVTAPTTPVVATGSNGFHFLWGNYNPLGGGYVLDPFVGGVKINSLLTPDTTTLYISTKCYDGAAAWDTVVDIEPFVSQLSASSKCQVKLVDYYDNTKWVNFTITGPGVLHTDGMSFDGTTYDAHYYAFPVTFIAENNSFDINNDGNAVVAFFDSFGGEPASSSNATSYTTTWSGTSLAYTGTPATGSYIKIGKLVFFNIKVIFTTVTNFGSGQYRLTLPFAPNNDYIFRNGGLHQGSVHYNIAGDAAAGTTTLTIYHMQNTNGSNSYVYDDPFTGTNPITLTTTGYMYLSGTYLTA